MRARVHELLEAHLDAAHDAAQRLGEDERHVRVVHAGEQRVEVERLRLQTERQLERAAARLVVAGAPVGVVSLATNTHTRIDVS